LKIISKHFYPVSNITILYSTGQARRSAPADRRYDGTSTQKARKMKNMFLKGEVERRWAVREEDIIITSMIPQINHSSIIFRSILLASSSDVEGSYK
jgi:hypothetical protein